MEQALVNKRYTLQRMPGKGGWTFIVIREITRSQRLKGGLIPIKGFIDDYALPKMNLMPMANGNMFMPIKAEIRKQLKKGEGDRVKLVLFLDESPLEIPQELLECLRDEPAAHDTFYSLPEGEQKQYVTWIYSARKEETRVARMAEAITRLTRGLTLRQHSAE